MNLLPPSERRQPADTEIVGADRVLAVLCRLGDYARGVGLAQVARDIEIPNRVSIARGRPHPAIHRERGR